MTSKWVAFIQLFVNFVWTRVVNKDKVNLYTLYYFYTKTVVPFSLKQFCACCKERCYIITLWWTLSVTKIHSVKGARSHLLKFNFLFHLQNDLSKDANVAYILLCKFIMVTTTRHIFIRIFQTAHFSNVTNFHGVWENYVLSFDTKIFKCLKRRIGKSELTPLRNQPWYQ